MSPIKSGSFRNGAAVFGLDKNHFRWEANSFCTAVEPLFIAFFVVDAVDRQAGAQLVASPEEFAEEHHERQAEAGEQQEERPVQVAAQRQADLLRLPPGPGDGVVAHGREFRVHGPALYLVLGSEVLDYAVFLKAMKRKEIGKVLLIKDITSYHEAISNISCIFRKSK